MDIIRKYFYHLSPGITESMNDILHKPQYNEKKITSTQPNRKNNNTGWHGNNKHHSLTIQVLYQLNLYDSC